MSRYVGYTCRTCNVDSPSWFNRGDATLREIFRLWPVLKPAYRALLASPLWELEFRWNGVHDDVDPLLFLNEHDGHDIALSDEYGRVSEVRDAD